LTRSKKEADPALTQVLFDMKGKKLGNLRFLGKFSKPKPKPKMAQKLWTQTHHYLGGFYQIG